jgi:hypothetical protein
MENLLWTGADKTHYSQPPNIYRAFYKLPTISSQYYVMYKTNMICKIPYCREQSQAYKTTDDHAASPFRCLTKLKTVALDIVARGVWCRDHHPIRLRCLFSGNAHLVCNPKTLGLSVF